MVAPHLNNNKCQGTSPGSGDGNGESGHQTVFDYNFTSSQNRSHWGQAAASWEEDLFLVEMLYNHSQSANQSFRARFGVGGQLYSLYNDRFGEAIAPQLTPDSLWVDEVFMNGAVPASNVKTVVEGGIHSAGTYLRDETLKGRPFWSPTLGYTCFDDTCIFAVWAQQAHVPTTYRSGVIGYFVYKNCGDGVLEHINMMHVFTNGSIWDEGEPQNSMTKLVHINSPWVGLRLTTFKEVVPSVRGTGLVDWRKLPFPTPNFGDSGFAFQQDTDGYITYAQDLPLPQGVAEEPIDTPCYRWRRTCTTRCFCVSCGNHTNQTMVETCSHTCDTWRNTECDGVCHPSQQNQVCLLEDDTNNQLVECPIRCMTMCTDAEFEFIVPVCNEEEHYVNATPPYRPLRLVVPHDEDGVILNVAHNWASLPTHDPSDFPTEEEYPEFQINGPWVACPHPVGVSRCLYLCGFLYTNVRTNQSVVVDSLRVWAYRRTGRSFVHINAQDYTLEYLNQGVFVPGDEIRITVHDCGKDEQDNLSLTFVHGQHPGLSMVRYGVGHQDVMVYTSIDNTNDVLPHETFVNRNYVVLGRFVDAEAEAYQWVNETKREVLTTHESGRRLEIYTDTTFTMFDVLFASEIGENDTLCENNGLQSVCVGSSTPSPDLVAHFYIVCGGGLVYFGPDPYFLAPSNQVFQRPWICENNRTEPTVRPTWKLMGYFPSDSCEAIQTAQYVYGNFQSLCHTSATPSVAPSLESSNNSSRAAWMSGKWGIGFRVSGGCHYVIFGVKQCYYVNNFNVQDMTEQLLSIGNLTYVIVGITSGANGIEYITWHSVLNEIAPDTAPPPPDQGGRDLFGELALAFRNEGIRTIAYVATEGPAKLRHGPEDAFDWDPNCGCSPSVDAWYAYVLETYGAIDEETMKLAFAQVIIAEFADRYGDLISGWWFDHSTFGDRDALKRVIRLGNPDAVIAFNQGQKIPLFNNNPGLEDYTAGHPNPIQRTPASDIINLPMVESIEASDDGYLWADGYASLGHMFMPVASTWNSLRSTESVWTLEQASDWMSQVLQSGGAWTWNVPRAGNRPTNIGLLNINLATFLQQVVASISDTSESPSQTPSQNCFGPGSECSQDDDCCSGYCHHLVQLCLLPSSQGGQPIKEGKSLGNAFGGAGGPRSVLN